MKHNRQGFIAWFIRKAVRGERIELFDGGQVTRDLNYVDDVVEALLLAGSNEKARGAILNLGGDEPVTLLDLAKLLLEITRHGSYAVVPFPNDKKRIDIGSVRCDYSRIKNLLGWKPQVGLREGLRRTVEYYQKYGKHYWD